MTRALAVLALVACGTAPAAYVAPARCASCHPDEAARWRGSHHDRAMEVAGPDTVLGDFRATAAAGGSRARDGDGYQLDGHRVSYTFGVEPLQQYLVDAPGGRLEASALAWDTARGAWFRVTPEDLPHRYRTWNTMCADCHSTAVDKGYDADTERFTTRFADVDVGCQACHGPGSRHAADPTQPVTARGDAEACAPCHARRATIAQRGATLLDRYRPMTLQAGLYFPDGQILDEVFEYGSFAQSAMHEHGVRCTDCHDPHSGRAAPGNALCTRCHSAAPPVQFPGLARRARDVDSPAHHHHQPGSPGAQCVACHMPERTYMKIDRRHDHSLRVPRPDLSVTLGVPNPCTEACHIDRDARWAAATVARWFPGPKPAAFGEVFARAQRGEAAPGELAAVATDRDRPAIVRATAFELLAAAPEACAAAATLRGLGDPSSLVRSAAVACGEQLAPEARAAFAGEVLGDPVRGVRIEAARILAGVALPAARGAVFAAARRELEDAYRADLDRPEGWFNLGTLAEAEGRRGDAIAHYRKALALDPDFVPARANLDQLAR
ncbi:MAG: tetratricopeptide repeat protein [Kofleriaceae bacterium]